MIDDPELEKLNAMAAKIKQAEGEPSAQAESKAKPATVSGAGFEFMGSILGGTLIGWLIDRELGTGPWFLVGMIFVGFAAGMVRVWKAMDGQK